ncbi:MAG TPA: hypothetical protein VNM66_09820 [Thermodesulfobacteriota bacterium]|nr:hypothetical protein [Thermodesulfobacteriota bacterium]
MRLAGFAAVLLAAAALAGCGGEEEAATWEGPPEPDASGQVSVEEFAAYQEDVDERWERSPALAAAEFVRLDERTAPRTTIESSAVGEGMGPQTVVLTLDRLLDDSVRAERWTLLFEPVDDIYRLSSARRDLRCQPGRGHQAFAPDPCA